MLIRVIVAGLLFAAGAGAAWYYKDLVSVSQVPTATASAPQGGGRTIEVIAERVRVAPVSETYQALGTANANEAVTIVAKVTGIVRSVDFAEGQMVKKGDLLVELDDREVRATLAQNEAEMRNARALLDRAQELLKSNNVPKARVDELTAQLQASQAKVDAARARLADMKILAPFNGKLGLRRISPGGLVGPNAIITTLDDASTIKLDFSVPEILLSHVATGRSIAARSAVFPDMTFEGRVQTIDSRIDPVTRSVIVRAELPNPKGLIKPGMLMTVDLPLVERPNALVVSEGALVPEGSEQYVYKIVDNRAVKTAVRIGVRQRGTVEILDGLTVDDRIVVGGIQKVRNGTRVKIGDLTSERPARQG